MQVNDKKNLFYVQLFSIAYQLVAMFGIVTSLVVIFTIIAISLHFSQTRCLCKVTLHCGENRAVFDADLCIFVTYNLNVY